MLYQKYRPKSFDEIVGNENTVDSLRQKLKKEEMPTVIVLTGPSGCGKTTIARIIKNEMGCSDLNFNELDMANTRGIDTIREVIGFSHFQTFDGGVRIFLLDEVHQLTRDAQNALLKILEDTPKNVYFILCSTDPQKIIKTIRTRCSVYPMTTISLFPLVSLLKKVCTAEGKNVAENVLKEVARTSEGSPRQALMLLEQVIDMKPERALEMIREIEIGSKDVIDICRILVNAKPYEQLVKQQDKWKALIKLLKNMEIPEPEKARIGILNYLTTVFVNNDGNPAIGKMMACFFDTVIYSGKGGLVIALWNACL